MTIIVGYKNAPPLNSSIFNNTIDAYFRGCKVGQVVKTNISCDQSCVEFHLEIYYKNLRLPKNTSILLRIENIYGKKYLDIHYPEIPSKELLSNGDRIEGLDLYEGIDDYLIEEFKVGHAKHFLENLSSIIEIFEQALQKKDNEKLIKQSAGDLAIIIENLKEIIGDPNVKKELKSTIKHSSGTLKNLDAILGEKEIRKSINQAPESISQTLQNIETMNEHMDKMTELMPEMNQSILKSNSLLTDSNSNLCSINNKVPEIPQSLVKNADKILVKTDCLETGLAKMMSERFLLLKLLFGKPGKSFNKCTEGTCEASKFAN